MAKHWSERLTCSCGMSFRGYADEAMHRHNFPALCRQPKKLRKKGHDQQRVQAEEVPPEEAEDPDT